MSKGRAHSDHPAISGLVNVLRKVPEPAASDVLDRLAQLRNMALFEPGNPKGAQAIGWIRGREMAIRKADSLAKPLIDAARTKGDMKSGPNTVDYTAIDDVDDGAIKAFLNVAGERGWASPFEQLKAIREFTSEIAFSMAETAIETKGIFDPTRHRIWRLCVAYRFGNSARMRVTQDVASCLSLKIERSGLITRAWEEYGRGKIFHGYMNGTLISYSNIYDPTLGVNESE